MSFDSMEASTSNDIQYSPDPTEERLCRVCCDRSDGAHFGIDSCRACAAFFRRSVVMEKKYVCRQGGNDCDISKSVRCMCRKCRLRKCLEAGMLPESVQSKRDPIVPRSTDTEPLGAAASDCRGGEGSPSESELRSSLSAFQLVNQLSPILSPMAPESSVSINIKPPEMPHLLYKINNNYKHLCAVRKSTEQSMNLTSIKRMFDDGGLFSGLTVATCSKTSQIYKAHIPATGEFVTNSFDEFQQLSQDEKWIVFQSFFVVLWGMDSAYRTYRMVPPDQFKTKMFMTETTYFDQDHPEDFFTDSCPSSKLSKQELVKLMTQCMGGTRLKMVNQMGDMQIQEEEYAAVLALSLWNPNLEQSTPNIDRISRQMRQKVFEQLHMYYRANSMDNYAARLGELMSLFSIVLHHISRLREDMELFNLFDVFQDDTFLYDLVKRS